MVKYHHEFRDPVHQFITVTSHERTIVDSEPVQRLRYIAQLALSSLVYPGATHRRFEHSLGVMEFAGQAFDVLIARQENVSEEVRDVVPELSAHNNFPYWRTVVRMAALCHDLGHLPFSHAAEHEILPEDVSHETLSEQVITSPEMHGLFANMVPPVDAAVVAKLAVGAEKASQGRFSVWESLLSEIITGDAFGVDRMDYLLRDSHHAGVAYGRFDHHRLIQTLRLMMPAASPGPDEDDSQAPVIGIERGGLEASESLALARYFMFSQVYFHPIRVVYDIHLVDFLRNWLPEGKYGATVQQHLATTDNEVLTGMRVAAADSSDPAHEPAHRILQRQHFKVLYERSVSDLELSPDPGLAVKAWAVNEYGEDAVRHKASRKGGGKLDFPVREFANRRVSSLSVSETLARLPSASGEYVFLRPDLVADARRKLTRNREEILGSWSPEDLEEDDMAPPKEEL